MGVAGQVSKRRTMEGLSGTARQVLKEKQQG